jgi:hypothetical protein
MEIFSTNNLNKEPQTDWLNYILIELWHVVSKLKIMDTVKILEIKLINIDRLLNHIIRDKIYLKKVIRHQMAPWKLIAIGQNISQLILNCKVVLKLRNQIILKVKLLKI